MAACVGAGTTLSAVESLLGGVLNKAYSLVRPPGHHASRNRADGYCYFNNAGIAAEAALAAGLSKVAIVDIDVHHGNGCQDAFFNRKDVLTVSIHMEGSRGGDSEG